MLLHFLHFKLMIPLLVTCFINTFLEVYTFSNLKLYVFVITGFICSDKCIKQVVLINHSWISPMLQRGWELMRILFILQKMEEGTYYPEKGRGW